MKKHKKTYIKFFFGTVILLAVVRLVFPSLAGNGTSETEVDTLAVNKQQGDTIKDTNVKDTIGVVPVKSKFFKPDGSLVRNRILSVPGFSRTFPDNNDVQMVSAKKYGVSPVQNRSEAEQRKSELVYIEASPYYHVDKLNRSIPYLVPRAANLLNEMGRAFYDSLQTKGVPLHKFIVTSVLRTNDDVKKLRRYNVNATENSCHLYGTTFDICYNRYVTVQPPGEPQRRAVRSDSLKWILSEVLRDMRMNNRCYVKYEVKQGCYHITVR